MWALRRRRQAASRVGFLGPGSESPDLGLWGSGEVGVEAQVTGGFQGKPWLKLPGALFLGHSEAHPGHEIVSG